MDISNQRYYQGSWYVNPNTRTLTSDRKNAAIKDRDVFGRMQHLLRPVEDMVQVLRTPVKLAERSLVDRESEENSRTKAAWEMQRRYNQTYTLAMEQDFATGEKVSYTSYASANYRIEPDNENECFTIYNGQGERLGAFFYSDIKCRQDTATGRQLLISENGTMWYEALALDQELKEDLQHIMGVDALKTEPLQGYTLKTHAGSGIQYVVKDGDEGRGGRVLLQSESDVQKYEALAETYFDRYPNLIESKEEAYIWASFEIRGMAVRTDRGILSIHCDGMSYNDNTDAVKNWSLRFGEDTYQMIFEWLAHGGNREVELEKFSVWQDILKRINCNNDTTESALQTPYMKYAEKAFYSVGSRAPREVKQAWMDAARETGANGLGIGANGMMTHISQMMVQRLKRNLTGRDSDADDILGNSVSSALRAANEALYDLENPRSRDNEKSLEVQYYRRRERAFYQAFIRNLEELM